MWLHLRASTSAIMVTVASNAARTSFGLRSGKAARRRTSFTTGRMSPLYSEERPRFWTFRQMHWVKWKKHPEMAAWGKTWLMAPIVASSKSVWKRLALMTHYKKLINQLSYCQTSLYLLLDHLQHAYISCLLLVLQHKVRAANHCSLNHHLHRVELKVMLRGNKKGSIHINTVGSYDTGESLLQKELSVQCVFTTQMLDHWFFHHH